MSAARTSHAATVLASGKVLVTGGANGSSIVATAQLYDPVSATWSAAASMHEARAGHTATRLTNGKVLVAGGDINPNGGEPLTASAELYDPASNTWAPAASLREIRAHHTATLLTNGEVLVTGGDGSFDLDFGHGFPTTAELYDPVSNTWSAAAGINKARWGLTATLVAGGKVLIVGGIDERGGAETAELYDPARDIWSAAASMTTPRSNHAATVLANGKVLVTGGSNDSGVVASAELYDPVSGAWSPAGSMSNRRYFHTATLLPSGKVLVSGGDRDRENGTFVSDVTASAELYDPSSRTWSAAASMSTARAGHRAALLANGKVLVAGGYTPSATSPTPVTASAELFGPLAAAAPRAVDDAYTTNLGASLVVSAPGVLRNDSDPNGDALHAVLVSGPAHGTLALNANGSLRYKPAEDFIGVDAFKYQASDGALRSSTESVRITVRAVCGGIAATKIGTSAADTITGTSGADVIVGLGGNDTILGLSGNDRLCGGSGADSIGGGAGDDLLIGGTGNDVLRGELGNDRMFGGAGADLLFGGDGNDYLDGGTNSPDACQGGAGSDTVAAGCEQVT